MAGALWGLVPRLVITFLEDVTQGLMYLCLYLVGNYRLFSCRLKCFDMDTTGETSKTAKQIEERPQTQTSKFDKPDLNPCLSVRIIRQICSLKNELVLSRS